MPYIPTLYFSPVSVQNTVYHPRSICVHFHYTDGITLTIYFSPVSVQKFVYNPRCISLLIRYTILYIIHDLFLSCFSTKICISRTHHFFPD